jgi:threonine/homoserine/homoserine lactone efflux protein
VKIVPLGTIFTLLAVVSDGAYVLLAGAVGGWLRTDRRARRRLAKLSGGVYIGLGVSAALSGSSHARPAQS